LKQYDRTLLDIFAAEQAEHVGRIRATMEALGAAPPDARGPALDEILRRAHTLKGAARAVGLETTERVAHTLEAMIGRVRDGAIPLDDRTAAVIRRGLESIEDVLASALAGRDEPDASAFRQAAEALPGNSPAPAAVPAPPSPATPPAPAAAPAAEFVRVNAARVDRLIRSASQLVAASHAQSAVEARTAAYLRDAGDTLAEYQRLRRQSIPYVREHQEDPQFAPLRECLEYIDERLRMLSADARDAAAAGRQRSWEMSRETADLYQAAIRVRMIPAESVFAAFGAMVREIAHQEGKQVDFRAEGMEAQADRVVLQALKDPVMHLLRNAVSHGIESPEDRRRAGKPPAGTIRLRVVSVGDRLNLFVEDDGRGLDLRAVAAKAVKRGLLTEEEAESLAPGDVAKLILRPGFSTSDVATRLSGRGMGLSVVEQTVGQLQGEVQIHPRAGRGFEIAISAALSISLQHVLLVAVDGRTYGLPARSVQRLVRIRPAELQQIENRDVVVLDSRPVPLVRLSALLGVEESASGSEDEQNPVIRAAVMNSGQQIAAVVVDGFVDDREAVVKDLGLNGELAGMTAGGVPLEDGSVAILLNPAAIFARLQELGRQPGFQRSPEQPQRPARRILVVDDSITTRSLEKSILEANGYSVRLAVDGVEALEQLSAELVDLVITDVAMPRMDGLQLLQQLKKRKETEHIPVIVVTSLESREDQQRGLSLGADAYIVKRKFDQLELLRTVRQIL
jgi:two-component system, chemotaxis family, sensor kinase CheA